MRKTRRCVDNVINNKRSKIEVALDSMKLSKAFEKLGSGGMPIPKGF